MAIAYAHDRPSHRQPLRLEPLSAAEQTLGYGERRCPRCSVSFEVAVAPALLPVSLLPRIPRELLEALTPRESLLFEALYIADGEWVPSQTIRQHVWGAEWRAYSDNIHRANLHRMRPKLVPFGWRAESLGRGGTTVTDSGAYRLVRTA